MDLLTGPALAAALFEKGLAPKGVRQWTNCYGRQGTFYLCTDKQEWRPWDTIQDVWHLVLRYQLHIRPSLEHPGDWMVSHGGEGTTHVPRADLPMLIGNVALWCYDPEDDDEDYGEY